MFDQNAFDKDFEKAWNMVEKNVNKMRRFAIAAYIGGFVLLGGEMVFLGFVTCKILKYYGVM